MFLTIVKKYARHFSTIVLCAALLIIEAGCQLGMKHGGVASIISPEDLSTAQAKAAKENRPLIVLITDSGNGPVERDAHAALASRRVMPTANKIVVTAWIDLSSSRARATAARFHPLETPLLICLSPHGVIIGRDSAPISENLILGRMQQAVAESPELDTKLDELKKGADNEKNNAATQMALADFLIKQNNDSEAIPVLAAIAHSDTVESSPRIRAWAELARAHFWVGEAEKGRFEAQGLMSTLGSEKPEARAAGNFVLGKQDATNPKHFARARREFEAAVAAAPDSTYGKQAAAALANLPKGDSTQ